jgi:hypothetical protein
MSALNSSYSVQLIIPSAIAAELAGNGVTAYGVAVFVVLEVVVCVFNADFSLVEEIYNGANTRAGSAAIRAAIVSYKLVGNTVYRLAYQ